MPGAEDLGAKDSAEAIACQLQEDAVIEHSRGMNHTSKRRHRRIDLIQHRGKLKLVGDIGLKNRNIGSLRTEFRNGFGIAFRSANQSEMFRSPFMHMFVQSVFLNFTLLFVGYSLSDPDFQLVLKEVNMIFSGGTTPHYALLPDPHEFTTEHLMLRMNIQIIPYSAADNLREAIEFLEALQKEKPYVAK